MSARSSFEWLLAYIGFTGSDEKKRLSEVLMADWVAMHQHQSWLHFALLNLSQQVCKFMHA